MSADPGFARRVTRLVTIKDKYEQPEDCVARMVSQSFLVESKLQGMSEKESVDCLIGMTAERNRGEPVATGIMYGLLTDRENFTKYFHQLSVLGGEPWIAALTSVNMIIIEIWPKLHEPCKENLVAFFRESIRMNVPKLENVIMHAIRTFNGSGEWNNKMRIASKFVPMLAENEQWLMNVKPGSFLFPVMLSTFGRLIADMPTPASSLEPLKTAMINLCILVIRNRFNDALMLGRDLLLLVLRLVRLPNFANLWRDLVLAPTKFGHTLEDVMFRSDHGYHQFHRVSPDVLKKIDFIIYQVKPNIQNKHFEWFAKQYLTGQDAAGLRAEMIRHVLWFFEPQGATGVDQQWAKTALWWDWLSCDPGCPYTVLEPVISLIKYSLQVLPQLANSIMEFGCRNVNLLHPPLSENMRKSVNIAMKLIADQYTITNHNLTAILESTRLERPIRDMVREVWKDYVRPVSSVPQPAAPINTTSPTASPSASPTASGSSSPAQSNASLPVVEPRRKDKEVKDKEEVILLDDEAEVSSERKVISPPLIVSKPRAQSREEIDKELDSLMEMLREDIRPIVETLRESLRADDPDGNEAVQTLLQRLLEMEDTLDEEQLEFIGQSVQLLIGRPHDNGTIFPDQPTDDKVQEMFVHPLFVIFRNLCYSPANDSTSRTMISLIASMRDKDPCCTYMLIYFMKGSQLEKTASSRDVAECYRQVAEAYGKDVEELLVEDLQQCAIDDDRLFGYLLSFVFDKFLLDMNCKAYPDIFRVICSNLDAKQLMSLVGDVVRKSITLFRKEAIVSLVTASFDWDTTSQWIFWQLVHAHGVPVDWLTSLIPKLRAEKNSEAATNVLLMLKRMDKEPTTSLLRSILSRTPAGEDSFTVNALTILTEESDMTQKVAEVVGAMMKKQMVAGDILSLAAAAKSQSRKGPQKLSLEQVLHHIQQFTQVGLLKGAGQDHLLSKWHLQESINAVKTCEKAAQLRPKFAQLFALAEIINEDNGNTGSNRTLRGNRSTGSSISKQKAKKDDDEEKDDTPPSKKKKNKIITLDSDSD